MISSGMHLNRISESFGLLLRIELVPVDLVVLGMTVRLVIDDVEMEIIQLLHFGIDPSSLQIFDELPDYEVDHQSIRLSGDPVHVSQLGIHNCTPLFRTTLHVTLNLLS